MDGLILVDKPQNITSHDIVLRIRNILNIKKVGHYGTLDPLATGLMLLALGKATRFFPFFSTTDKVYEGLIRLGFSTDTYDSAGKPTSSEEKNYPQKDNLLKAMKKFEGEIQQLPPPYSAKKYKGKPLYALVREKKDFELRPSKVFIHFFQLVKYNPPLLEFKTKCSSGTYVRSLAHDLGEGLGCRAHLSELIRTDVGNFNIKESRSLGEIKRLADAGKIDEFLIPFESLLPEFPKIILKERGSVLVKNGNLVSPENIQKIIINEPSSADISLKGEEVFRMFSLEGRFLALAKKVPEKHCFHPFLVMDSKETKQ
ncbi:MAG TPA: tRNA pseudouridine(55) synthase TruB [Candidatus Aminicenantes bacterium]|nr:tRNA pseudouridine(55) synthase TruB [Candidatus Aminicenantes bacterium]